MKNIKINSKSLQNQCDICSAGVEIWLDNARLNEERREEMGKHLLSYCPVCAKVGE